MKKEVEVLQSDFHLNNVINNLITKYRQDEAFYVCNIGEIANKFIEWKESFPRIQTYFAVSCNDQLVVLKLLAAIGCGFNCGSEMEIQRILDLKVNPSRISFYNPTKFLSHIKYAAEVGVLLLTVDNENEMRKIKDLHPNANLIIRIKPNNLNGIIEKYGATVEDEAPILLSIAHELNLKVVGVSFNVTGNYPEAIESAKLVFKAAASFGFQMKILDIGEVFSDEMLQFAKSINEAISLRFPCEDVQIIADPSKLFVTSAFHLVSNIHSIRKVEMSTSPTESYPVQMYHLDIGVYNGLMSTLRGVEFNLRPLKYHFNADQHKSIVWGPTLDSVDEITKEILLPKMDLGEWMIVDDAGAYTITLACEFNGYVPPEVFYVIDKNDLDRLGNLLQDKKFLDMFK